MNWLTEEETFEWLSDDKMPERNVQHMLQYIRTKWPDALTKRVLLHGQMPQSFAHWWVHSRVTSPETFEYTFLKYWRQVAGQWQADATADEDIIAMFKTWLDLLLVDITSFEDEHHTEGVPRLYADGKIHYDKNTVAPKIKRATKRATVDYIVSQCSAIFEERGFTEGLEWWNNECKLIKSL